MEILPNKNIDSCCTSCASGGGCGGNVNGLIEDLLTGTTDTTKPIGTIEMTLSTKTLLFLVGGIILSGLIIKKF